jgi:DNA-binding LacI/PurR family transcriptional regulator
VADHGTVARDLQGWICSRRHIRGKKRPKVIMAAMEKEPESEVFARSVPGTASIRNDRIDNVWAALEGMRRLRVTVPDYGFRHAWTVWKQHRDADLFVCLSDALAIGLAHLIKESPHRASWQDRVIGFDGSPLAQAEGIASLSQNLSKVGELALQRVCKFLADSRHARTPRWPRPSELEQAVTVGLRESGD